VWVLRPNGRKDQNRLFSVAIEGTKYSHSELQDLGHGKAEFEKAGLTEDSYGHRVDLFSFDKTMKITRSQLVLVDDSFTNLEQKVADFQKTPAPSLQKGKSVDKER